jgi:spore coat polysaccharide biosynthesis protein SpsF
MSADQTARSEQEAFWQSEFGEEYISRNEGGEVIAANLNMFAQALRRVPSIKSCTELGTNIGMNLEALGLLFPGIRRLGVEINPVAAEQARTRAEDIFVGAISSWQPAEQTDLAFTKTVMIHINPEELPSVYDKLHAASSRYILVAEYYNPAPVEVPYRGHRDRLFKRDFAGEMMDRFSDLHLVDYGFVYSRDPAFPLDDITWFLMEKRGA